MGALLNGNIQTTTPYGQGNANLSMLSQQYKNLGLELVWLLYGHPAWRRLPPEYG